MSPSHLPETPIFVKARGFRAEANKKEGRILPSLFVRTNLLVYDLDIVVEREFMRVWAETKGIEFFGPLPVNPGFDDILGEDIPFE